jgi:hypothetical protein
MRRVFGVPGAQKMGHVALAAVPLPPRLEVERLAQHCFEVRVVFSSVPRSGSRGNVAHTGAQSNLEFSPAPTQGALAARRLAVRVRRS